MTVLFRTRHGSHLYGLAHADSDEDWYTVIANPGSKRKTYAKQSIRHGIDIMTVSLSTFRTHCDNGVPQALEALFSQEPETDLLTDFRASYRINTAQTTQTYMRTMKNFALDEKGGMKKRMHAVRLAQNLGTMLATGRFNPRMEEWQIAEANHYAMLMIAEDPDPYFTLIINETMEEYE